MGRSKSSHLIVVPAITAAKVEGGANVVMLGLGEVGLIVIQARGMAGAEKILGADLNRNAKS